MKKGIIIISALVIILCAIFVACSSDKENKKNTEENTTTTQAKGLEANEVEYGFETDVVTDKNGKEVTDKDGKKQTTEVQVVYTKNNKDKYVAQIVDDEGKPVTDKNGKEVTKKSDYADQLNDKNTTSKDGKETTSTKTKPNVTVSDQDKTLSTPTSSKETTTAKTGNSNVNVTKDPETSAFTGDQKVPKTNDKGKEVYFSNEDYQKVASMLEVPYLYLSSYENEDGVPINIATYTAVWMAQQNGESAAVYPSSPVVLNLFKFYGQTVINFKTKCNDIKDTPIKYNKNDDTFTVNKYNDKKQSVKITKVEDMGNDNFYKVTGTVSNAGDVNKVVAIIQKNKLEPTLGFSIKALKWS